MQEREPIREPEEQQPRTPAQPQPGRETTAPAGRAPSLHGQIRQIIRRQQWLDPIAESVQGAVGKAMSAVGPTVTDFLHGTWLGHPLHPVLTDATIGAWTAAAALDVLEAGAKNPRLAPGADAAVALGVAAAVPTAMSGMADWRHVSGFPRRVGLLHASLNGAALLLHIASLGMRSRGHRQRGVALSLLGYLAAVAAAWLGGQLVYQEHIGVDRSVAKAGPKDFVPVMRETELEEGRLRKVNANGVDVLLFRRGSQIYAIGETCAHEGGPLSKGRLEDDTVICPWHGSQYRLADGKVVHGPSAFDQPCYDVRVRDGQIEVRQATKLG